MRLIEKVWFQQHAAKWLLVPLLLPLSFLFWLLSLLRRLAFRLGLKETVTLSKPVIVVGNIGVGGNGKTPMVIYLIQLLRSMGASPGVISRGYGGKAPYYPYLLSDESTADLAGDEPILIYQRCNVPVVVGADRIASGQLLIEQGCDIIISDDGLQHYRLARDLELTIVDGKRLFGNGLLLPAGPLREGTWRLATSDLVIYNGTKKPLNKVGVNTNTSASTDVSEYAKQSLNMRLSATDVCHIQTGEKQNIQDFLIHNLIINAIAGIGDPQRFFNTLASLQFSVEAQQGYVDHHHFTLDDFSQFSDNIALLMTEKDAVKCHGFAQANWWYLPVDAQFSEQEETIIKDKINSILS